MNQDSNRRSPTPVSYLDICSTTKGELAELVIQHGPENIFDRILEKGISTVAYNSNKKGFLLVDNSGIIRGVSRSGQMGVLQFLQLPINHLLHNKIARHFIGWLTKQTHIIIISENFDMLTTFYTDAPIVSILTSNSKPEFLMIDTTEAISKWHFDSKAKIIKDHTALVDHEVHLNTEKVMLYNCIEFECFGRPFPELYIAIGSNMLVIDYFSGILLSKHTLHKSEITALTYLAFEKYMVTGTIDGKIRIWNASWEPVTQFLGHMNAILKLIPCPYGELLLSLSEDNTIKTWNINTVNEIACISLNFSATGLIADDQGQLLIYSEYHISLYIIQNLYNLMLSVSSPLKTICTAQASKLPIRLLVSSEQTIYVINGINGEILSKINITKPGALFVNLRCILSEGILFALRDDGRNIIKMSIKEQTGKITRRWAFERDGVCCLGIYQYTIPTKKISPRSSPSERSLTSIPLLFVGFFSGKISQLHLHTGLELYTIKEAHEGPVLHMICKPQFNTIVTAGKDRIIKVWQLLCESKGPVLVPYVGFTAFDDIECIDSAEELVAVATTNREEREFRFAIYSYICCTCKTHCLADDHLDSVINISSLESLKLFSTTGRDKTIRIWTHSNELLRIIQIDCIPIAAVFCNIRGDLAVGIRHHIFTINHKKYLPKDFYKYVSSPIMFEETEAKPTTANQRLMEDIKAILNAEYITPSQYDLLANTLQIMKEEDELKIKEEDEKEKALARLKKRTEEIYSIRDGTLVPSRKSVLDVNEKENIFMNYFDSLWKKSLDMPNLPLLLPPAKPEEKIITVQDQFPKLTRKKSFFPHPDEMEVDQLNPEAKERLQLKVIPNSVIIKILWPNETSWSAWKSWNKFHFIDTSKPELKPKTSSELFFESVLKSEVRIASKFSILTFNRPLEEKQMKQADFNELILIRKGKLSLRGPVENLEIIRATTIDKHKTTLCLRDSPELYKLSDEEREILKMEVGPNKIFTQIHILSGIAAREVAKRTKNVIDLAGARTPYRRPRAKSPDQLRVRKLEESRPEGKVPVQLKTMAADKIEDCFSKPSFHHPILSLTELKMESEVKFMAKLPEIILLLSNFCEKEEPNGEAMQELIKMGLVDPNNLLLAEVRKWCKEEIQLTDVSSLQLSPTEKSGSCYEMGLDIVSTEKPYPPCPVLEPLNKSETHLVEKKSTTDDLEVISSIKEEIPESTIQKKQSMSNEPIAESIAEPVPEPVPEPIPEPIPEPVPETVSETVAKPITEPVPEPVPEIAETAAEAFQRRAITWFTRWTTKFVRHLLSIVESLEKGELKGCISSSMLKVIVADCKGTLKEGIKSEDAVNLTIPYQYFSEKTLLENINPVDVLNYFCEMTSEKTNRRKMKQPEIKSKFTACDIYMKKEVGLDAAFAPWPAYLHLPLKKGEVILFRRSKDMPKPPLLTYQTSTKFFHPSRTTVYSAEEEESDINQKNYSNSERSETKIQSNASGSETEDKGE